MKLQCIFTKRQILFFHKPILAVFFFHVEDHFPAASTSTYSFSCWKIHPDIFLEEILAKSSKWSRPWGSEASPNHSIEFSSWTIQLLFVVDWSTNISYQGSTSGMQHQLLLWCSPTEWCLLNWLFGVSCNLLLLFCPLSHLGWTSTTWKSIRHTKLSPQIVDSEYIDYHVVDVFLHVTRSRYGITAAIISETIPSNLLQPVFGWKMVLSFF